MCINSSRCYEKIESRRKAKHFQNSTTACSSSATTPSSTPSSLKASTTPPNDNLSFIDIHITKHCIHCPKHSTKTDVSFRNEQKPPLKPNQKIIIELHNNNNNNTLSSHKVQEIPNRHSCKESTSTCRTITHSNSPLKNGNVNISNIRKAFFNLNRRSTGNNNYNITPIKRRVKSPQVLGIKDKIIKNSLVNVNNNAHVNGSGNGICNKRSNKHNNSSSHNKSGHHKKNFHSNNSSCSKRNERIIISTLPRAIIDISNCDPISQGLNFTYNNDEVVNMFLKLKSKNTKINAEMASELKLLRDEIDDFIKKYNS